MATLVLDLELVVSRLSPANAVKCCEGCRRAHPTIRAYDAGQAYEMIEKQLVMRDLESVLRKARDRGHGLVQVLKFVKPLTANSFFSNGTTEIDQYLHQTAFAVVCWQTYLYVYTE